MNNLSLDDRKTLKKIFRKIKQRIAKHRKLYPKIPIKGELWEHILYDSLKEMGYSALWDSGSHKEEEDIFCTPWNRISCKSGKYVKSKNIIQISGSRTTRFKELDEKLNHLTKKHSDWIFSLEHNKITDNYTIHIINTDILKYNDLSWTSCLKTKNFQGVSDGLKINIVKAMSDQVWYDISLDSVSFSHKIS